MDLSLSKSEARRLLLAHQCLWPPRRLKGKSGALAFVKRVRCIQYDPLNVVGRNPELVLQSRVSGFKPWMLEKLLYGERALVDGWDKQMSIYPIEDWPYFERRRRIAKKYYGSGKQSAAPVLPSVRKAVKERGPLSSVDLEHDQKVEWPWGPARISRAALESMFWWGELVIHHRESGRKVYDLAARHVPECLLNSRDPNRTEAEYRDWHVLRRLRGVGLLWPRSSEAWLLIPGVKSGERAAALSRLRERGMVKEVRVEGISQPLYMASEDKAALESSRPSSTPEPRASLIAPLDNLMWDRGLVKSLFDFDYTWEVYKPVALRRYGYYVLPILYADRFVARFEPTRDGAEGEEAVGDLVIKRWWWEEGIRPSDAMRAALIRCFTDFLGYLGATGIRVEKEAGKEAGLSWLARAL